LQRPLDAARTPLGSNSDLPGRGLAALEAGDLANARALFSAAADSAAEPSGEVLLGLAKTIGYSGDWAGAAPVMERAYQALVAEGANLKAVTAAAFMVSGRNSPPGATRPGLRSH
jgi:thioredoxin-like negative regulator of GroEL